MIIWFVLVIVLLAGLALLLGQDAAAMVGLEPDQLATMIYVAVPLMAAAAYVFREYDGRLLKGARDFGIWLGIGLALIGLYAFRGEMGMVAGRISVELQPPGTAIAVDNGDAAVPGERAVRLRRRGDGHFVARADVNGQSLLLMVDTGATSVVLRPADAERAGIDLSGLVYSAPVNTANGTAFAAPVRLKSITIGPIEVKDVQALVAKPGALDENLLGLSFLNKIGSTTISGDFLTLRG
jgi:aspartyl protease family protein